MTDKILLDRRTIDYAAHALEHFNKDYPDQSLSEIIYHLRTALNKPHSDLQVENDSLRKIIYKLADQQAIPDDWWEQELAAIDQARK